MMGPFIKSKNKTSKIMFNLLIAIFPIIIFSIYKNGYIPYIHDKTNFIGLVYPLLFIITGAMTSLIIEFIYYRVIKKQSIKDSYSVFPGLFLALILPFKTPIYILMIGAMVSSISKIIFGGFGKNIFNPALIGYIFVTACYGSFFATNYYFNSYELDTISTPTPLTNVTMLSDVGSYDKLVKPYGSLFDFFVGTIPGSLAETSALLCLVALLYLGITKTIKWKIPVFYLLTVFVLTFSIGRLLGQGIYYPLFHLFSGGLLFGAVFMATDPITSAVTPTGQIFQGVFLGILTVTLRFLGVEGVATSILILNIFVFILDKIGVKIRFSFIKSLVLIIFTFIIAIFAIFYLASSKKPIKGTDPKFNIISKDKTDSGMIYVVTQKGYGGNIKARITFQNDKITSIEIISNSETSNKYEMVINADYINTLISSQSNIDDLDTVSGATVTSNALKKMIINVMEDYN